MNTQNVVDIERDVTSLERATQGPLRLTLGLLRRIADAYGIHHLMLDPLCARYESNLCRIGLDDLKQWATEGDDKEVEVMRSDLAKMLKHYRTHAELTTQSVDARFRHLQERRNKHYGSGAVYANPLKRLVGTQRLGLVHLTLENESACSDEHRHTGDEIMFVRKGNIEVTLKDTQLRLHLKPHDLLHFYAEQQHCCKCLGGDEAQVLIIRFWTTPRLKLLGQLQGDVARLPLHLRKRVRDEAVRALCPFNVYEMEPDPEAHGPRAIIDRVGLGRLLKFSLASSKTEPAKALERLPQWSRSRLERLFNGDTPINSDDVSCIANAFGLEPFVLYEFFGPTQRMAIGVPDLKRRGDAWELIPERFVSGGCNASYYVPKARLEDADVSISLLQLGACGSTPLNQHPGHELIIPVNGSCVVRHDSQDYSVDCDKHIYAHFTSSRKHQVLAGPSGADVLVLRFYEEHE